MRLFVGTHIHKIDRKGRVSVPASFRLALSEQPFNGIIAYPHLEKPCLEGGGVERLDKISTTLDNSFGIFSEEEEAFASSILAHAHQLQFDDGGRIILPQELKGAADLDDQIAFIGLGKRFQVWNPLKWKEAKEGNLKLARSSRQMLANNLSQ